MRYASAMSTKMQVSDYIAQFLAEMNTPAVYQLSGGMIAFIADAIFEYGRTPIINLKHEQAAGFAAEGATRVTSRPSVALGTSGPGATNLITAIASSFFDSVPVVYITGQVSTAEIKKNRFQRQNGFQELNICELTAGITKYSKRVDSSEEVPSVLRKAWEIAQSDRPGPVLIDIPIDIQQQFLDEKLEIPPIPLVIKTNRINDNINLESLFKKSRKPMILVGGGVRASDTVSQLRSLVSDTGIPAVASLMGIDALDWTNPLSIGFIGSYGNRWANKALADSDTLLVLGSRLDSRQTGNSAEMFVKDKKIIRIDIDDAELNGRITSDDTRQLNLCNFFEVVQANYANENVDFTQEIHNWKQEFSAPSEQISTMEMNPNIVMSWINKFTTSARGYVVDVGQHQMWAAQSIRTSPNQRFLTSGGLGAMGFSLPAAIGCASTLGGEWVVVIGDGCLQLSIAELQTIATLNLEVTICLINNNQHGMVAQFQEENMDSRFVGTRIGYNTPNFQEISAAFRVPSISISSENELESMEIFLDKTVKGPRLIEFVISQKALALPKLGRYASLKDL